jgi:hypothetical protein
MNSHQKNEIYMDVIERVTCLIIAGCNTIRSEVAEIVIVNCMLSGMPTCTLDLMTKHFLNYLVNMMII